MRILLTESDPGVAAAAAATFTNAGHDVLRCTSGDGAAFPCTGLADGHCPLDIDVDVAVTIRAPGRADPTNREGGVTCALRRRLPLVVGGGRPSAFGPWAGENVGTTTGAALLAVVERVARADSSAHAAVATAEVEARLGLTGVDAEARRGGGGLRVVVHVPTALDAKQRETLGGQVAGALRDFDGWVGTIDVSIVDKEETLA